MSIARPTDGERGRMTRPPDAWPEIDEGALDSKSRQLIAVQKSVDFVLDGWRNTSTKLFDGRTWFGSASNAANASVQSHVERLGNLSDSLRAGSDFYSSASSTVVAAKNQIIQLCDSAQAAIDSLNDVQFDNSSQRDQAVDWIVSQAFQANCQTVSAAAQAVKTGSSFSSRTLPTSDELRQGALSAVTPKNGSVPQTTSNAPRGVGENQNASPQHIVQQRPIGGAEKTDAPSANADQPKGSSSSTSSQTETAPSRGVHSGANSTQTGDPTQGSAAAAPTRGAAPPSITPQIYQNPGGPQATPHTDNGSQVGGPSVNAPATRTPAYSGGSQTSGGSTGSATASGGGSSSGSGSSPSSSSSTGGAAGTSDSRAGSSDAAKDAQEGAGAGGGQGGGADSGARGAGTPDLAKAMEHPTVPAAAQPTAPAAASPLPPVTSPEMPIDQAAATTNSHGAAGASAGGAAGGGSGLGAGGGAGGGGMPSAPPMSGAPAMPLGAPATPTPAAPSAPGGGGAAAASAAGTGGPGVNPASTGRVDSAAAGAAPVPVSAARMERDAISSAAAGGAMGRKRNNGNAALIAARRIAAALNIGVADFGFFWVTGLTADGAIVVANSYGLGYIPEGVNLPEQVVMATADESILPTERARWATYPILAIQGWAQAHEQKLRAVIATEEQFASFDPGAAKIVLKPDDIPESGQMQGRSRLTVISPQAAARLAEVPDAALMELLPPAPADASGPQDKSNALWFELIKPLMSTAPERIGIHLQAFVAYAEHAQELALHRAHVATEAAAQRAAIADWVYWQHLSVLMGEATDSDAKV